MKTPARSSGTLVCTRMDPGLHGKKLLFVQPISHDNQLSESRWSRSIRLERERARPSSLPAVKKVLFRCFPNRTHRCGHHGDCGSFYLEKTMILGKVIGPWSRRRRIRSMKAPSCCWSNRFRSKDQPMGDSILAVDSVGAGVGEKVLIVQEGRAANEAFQKKQGPLSTPPS